VINVGIPLSELLKKIDDIVMVQYANIPKDTIINAVRILEYGQKTFHSGNLYIGKASNLPKSLPKNSAASFLCTADVPVPARYKGNPCVNIILFDGSADIHTVLNRIQDALFIKAAPGIFSQRLLDSLIRHREIQDIINVGYEFLGNPIWVTDTGLGLLASSYGKNTEAQLFNETDKREYFLNGIFSREKPRQLFIETLNKSKDPVIYGKDGRSTPFIAASIRAGIKTIGYLFVLEVEKPLNEYDIELAAMLCSVISVKVQESEFSFKNRGLMFEHFLIDILNGKIRNNEIAVETLKYLDLHFEEYFYILTIDIDSMNWNNTSDISLRQIKNLLEMTVKNSKCLIYNGAIVMLISCREKIISPEIEFKKLIDLLKKNQIYAGLSRSFQNIIEMQAHYRQSAQAVKAGRLMGGGQYLFQYEDYAIYHIFDIRSKQADLKDFCHSSIFKLLEYDYKNNTNYYDLLKTYLLKKKRQVDTANALYIHRSTISYHISKIREIMGVDLDDPETTYHLMLTYEILDYINRK